MTDQTTLTPEEIELVKAQTLQSQREAEQAAALARKHNLEADSLAGSVAVREAGNAQMLRQYQMGELSDFNTGHFEFVDGVSDATVDAFLSGFRLWSRMNPKKDVRVILDSPGGSIFAGFHFIDEFKRVCAEGQHKSAGHVRGMAASMGGVIIQAFDKRYCGRFSRLMFHASAGFTVGKSFEVQDEVELMKSLEADICELYSERSGKSTSFFRKLLDKRKDCWFTASEALKAGIIDAIG